MKYKLQERIQHCHYECEHEFLFDVLSTLIDEELMADSVSIISDKCTTELIMRTMCQMKFEDFIFDFQSIDFRMNDESIDEYFIHIFNDGEVYIEPAINKDAEYKECDGILFVESEVSEDAYQESNQFNEVMVFSINDFCF